MKFKVRYIRMTDVEPLVILDKGEWVDLRLSEPVYFEKGEFKYLPLGIRMQIPKGFEAHIAPRSGTYSHFKILQPNSPGVVDSSFSGPGDMWKMPALAMENVSLSKNTRICQFRIMPSQKATMEQKLRWHLSDGIEFVEEEWLTGNEENRGGFGSTGEN